MNEEISFKKAIQFAFFDRSIRTHLSIYLGYNLFLFVCAIVVLILMVAFPPIGIIALMFLYVLLIFNGFIFGIYNIAIKYDIAEAVMNEREVTPFFENFKEKLLNGIKIYLFLFIAGILLSFIYYILAIVITVLGFAVLFVLSILAGPSSIIFIILMVLLIYIGSFTLSFLINFIVFATTEPVIWGYLHEDKKIEAFWNFDAIIPLIKKMYKIYFKMTLGFTLMNLVEGLINIPFIIGLVWAAYAENTAIAILIGILLLIINLPLMVFNIVFNNIAVPHLIGQSYKIP